MVAVDAAVALPFRCVVVDDVETSELMFSNGCCERASERVVVVAVGARVDSVQLLRARRRKQKEPPQGSWGDRSNGFV